MFVSLDIFWKKSSIVWIILRKSLTTDISGLVAGDALASVGASVACSYIHVWVCEHFCMWVHILGADTYVAYTCVSVRAWICAFLHSRDEYKCMRIHIHIYI